MPSSQLFRFAIVGTIGFAVDSAVLLVLARGLAVAPLPARVASFVCAASATYLLNRRFTFRVASDTPGRWAPYLSLAALGAMINIGIFQAWISTGSQGPGQLLLGSALGSVVAAFFNYFTSRTLIFKA